MTKFNTVIRAQLLIYTSSLKAYITSVSGSNFVQYWKTHANLQGCYEKLQHFKTYAGNLISLRSAPPPAASNSAIAFLMFLRFTQQITYT